MRQNRVLLSVALILLFLESTIFISLPIGYMMQGFHRSGNWTQPVSLSFANTDFSITSGDRAIAVDSQGNVHIAVYGSHAGGNLRIYYWTNKYGGWISTDISSLCNTQGDQLHPVIALDSKDAVHIVWMGCPGPGRAGIDETDVFYIYGSENSWSELYNITKTPDKDEGYPSIVIDSSDTLHIIYTIYDTEGEDPLMYVSRSSEGEWSTPEKVTNPPHTFEWILDGLSVAVDSEDNVYAAFSTALYGQPGIYVTNNSAGFWSAPYDVSRWLTQEYSYVHDPSMAIDNNDDIHIAWETRGPNRCTINYMNILEVWRSPESLDATGQIALDASLAVDSEGTVHIVFSQYGEEGYQFDIDWYASFTDIFYANNKPGNLGLPDRITSTDMTSEGRTHLALDDDGHAHVIYRSTIHDEDNRRIYYVKSGELQGYSLLTAYLPVITIVPIAIAAMIILSILIYKKRIVS